MRSTWLNGYAVHGKHKRLQRSNLGLGCNVYNSAKTLQTTFDAVRVYRSAAISGQQVFNFMVNIVALLHFQRLLHPFWQQLHNMAISSAECRKAFHLATLFII